MKILIAGGGIAGLGAAMALQGAGREILVYDRDPPPPDGAMDKVFEAWKRPGAAQLRHSHVFLARLFTLIRNKHPALLERLIEAGARELKFHDTLPATLRHRYRPRRGDGDISILSCRRTTLEAVMRRHAAELPGVTLVTGAKVRGILIEKSPSSIPRATGLKIEHDGRTKDVAGDIVIDAAGRNTPFPDWLARAGIDVPTEEAPAGIIYYTRHYRLRPGQKEPSRSAWLAPSAGDLGYIKYGVFPADNRRFSITLALPEIEGELRRRIVDGRAFDRICASLPGVLRWTDPVRAEPVTKVQAMGRLHSIWRHWVVDGVPLILDFFALGDATIRTNPLYGRGCSTGFLEAHLLADVLRKTADRVARAKLFDLRVEEELRPFFDSMVRQDRAAIRLARQLKSSDGFPDFSSRFARSLAEHGIVPAIRREEHVLRSLMASLHMLQGPDDWMMQPGVMSRIFMMWATPRPLKARFYPGELGPRRSEMIELVQTISAP